MNKIFIITLLAATALLAGNGFAKDKEVKTGGMDAASIPKAANGGMTEVELGKLAAEKGASQEVKDFGNQITGGRDGTLLGSRRSCSWHHR